MTNSRLPTLLASFLSACLLAAHMPSIAAAAANATAEGGPGQQVIDDKRDPGLLIAEANAVSGGSSASAYANLSSGVVRSFALATNAYPGTPYAASATSTVLDLVRFSGGVGQTAYLDWSFDGSLSYTNPSMATFGQMLVYIGSSFANIMLTANRGNCGQGSIFADCTLGTSVSKQGSIPFVISILDVNLGMNLGASLQAYSQFGNAAQFANTGKLYLRTPEGVTFTSTTGQFLNDASPILAVPEPESYAMMVAGLGGLWLMMRLRGAPTCGAMYRAGVALRRWTFWM